MGLGHWVDQAFDHVNDLVQKKALPDAVMNPLTSAAGSAIDFVGGVTKDAALDMLDALKWDRDHLISQPLSAGELLLNPKGSIYTDAGQNNPWTAHPTPSIFKAAWQQAAHVSPMQASLANYGTLANLSPAPVRSIGQAVLGPVAAPGFDVNSPDQRNAAFDSWTNAGKYVTGIGDAALSFYAGPGVPEGKALMLARSKGLIKPLAKGAVDSSQIERITTKAPGLAEDAGLFARTKEKVVTPFDAQRRVTKMTDDLALMTPAQRADYLARNTSMRSSPGLISLMTRAPDSDAMRMVLRYAMDPNPLTKTQLENHWAQARDEVDRLRYTKIPELEKSLQDLPTRMGSYLGDGGTAVGQLAISEAQKSLEAAKLTKDYYRDVLTVRGTLKNVPRVNLRQGLATGLAESSLHLDWDVLQPSRYGVVTRILKSAGEKRAGVIDVNRTNHATEQMRLAVDRVGHGTSVLDRFGNRTGGGLPEEVKDGLVLDMSNAERIGPAAVMDVVQKFEQTALVHYGKMSRVEGESDEDILKNVQSILEATGVRRDAVRAKFGMISKDATYSGAPRLDAAGQPTGRLLDEVQDGVGIWSHNPMTETNFADRIPMLDVDRLARVMNRHRLAMVGQNRGHFLAAMRGDGGAITNANAIVTEALEGFNRYWKPAQLARLGWPIRVITDENLRIYSVLGVMSILPLQIQSVAHGVAHTRPAYAARDIWASKRVLAAKHEIAQLHDVRVAGKQRAGLVGDLEDLNAHIAALDTVIPKLADKLTAQHAALQGTDLHAITGTRGTLRDGPGGITMKFGDGAGDRAPGETTHTRVGLSEHDPEVYRTTAADTDAGVATLRDSVDSDTFTELNNEPVEKLRQRLIFAGVDPKVADGTAVRQELLSLYGKQLARNAGHKAIDHAPAALGDSVARTQRVYPDTRGGQALREGGQHYTTASTPFAPTASDAFDAADAARLSRAMGADAPGQGMSLDELRSWTGANATTEAGAKFDAAMAKVLREQGRRGPGETNAPHVLDVRRVFDTSKEKIGPEQARAISTMLGAGDPGRAMSIEELRTWTGANGGRDAAKFTAEVRRTLKREGYDATATPRPGGHTDYTVLERGRVHAHMPGAPERTYTALHPDALRSADRTEFNQTADLLDRLTDSHDTLTAATQHLTGRIAAKPAWTQAQEDNWGELVNAALKPSQKAKVLGKPAKFSGTVKMHLPSGAVAEVPDAGHGQAGRISLDLSSASGTMRDLAGLDRKQINKMRLEVGDPATILPTTDEKGQQAVLHELSYDRGWERATNDQIANSMIGKLILEGKNDDEIVLALRRTPKGQDLVRMNPVRGDDPHQWVEDVRQHVNHYLPTPELKYAASKGLVTAQMLKDTFPTAAMRPVIHGESLEMATGRHPMTAFMERRVEGLYKKLGTTPTDALSRHPFFTEHYRQELQRQVTRNVAPDATTIDPDHLEQMMRAAREHALTQVKNVLYDSANQTHLGHALRFVSPFYNAWAEALTVWSKLWMEDPARIARLVQVWNAPTKMHTTYIDSYGVEQVALPLPGGVAKALGASKLGMPKNTIEQLIFQGQYWWMPGAGAPVTVPLGEIVRQRPDLADSMKPFLPYGTGANPIADVLPSSIKKAATLARKEDDPTYVGEWVNQVQQVATDRELGRNHLTDAQVIAEAHRRASAFTAFKFITSLVAPAQVSVRPEYQMFYDQLKTLQAQYRTYPGGKDPQGRDAGEAFLQANGDDFHYLLGSTTKSNIGGIAPTVEGYKATKKYAKEIQANPQWGAFFVGDEDKGDYSSAAQLYQKQTRIGGGDMDRQRSQVQPGDVIKNAQVDQGWDEFRRVDTMVDSALKERGLKSVNVKAAADIKAAKDKLVADLEVKYPAWKVAKATFTTGKTDRFVDMVNDLFAKKDPRFVDRPGFTTLGRYLASRSTLVSALAERKGAGGSDNLQADQNTDLRNAWETIVGNLRLQDTAFADLQTRWLTGDRLESGGKS